jgi:hypothetical protein
MAADESLVSQTISSRQQVAGTTVAWDQPTKILPVDAGVREAILAIEADVESSLNELGAAGGHLPSRVRSLIWIACAIPILEAAGYPMPDLRRAERALQRHLTPARHVAMHGVLNALIARRAS